MHELTRILELWRELESKPQAAILATVLRTQGSSYRLPGARLLLLADGRYAGSISGGCLEEEIVKRAWWLTANGPVLRRYDTTPDGEIASSGFGLGCNGIIHVLLEQVLPGPASVLAVLAATRQTRQPATIAHLMLPVEAVGQRLVVTGDGAVRHNLTDAGLAERIRADIAAGEEGPATLRPAYGVEVFLERVTPPVHLLVFGAGQDAGPLTTLAKHLGWHISVFDGRAHYVKEDRFPHADSLSVRSLGAPSPAVDEWTAAVIMSHSYSQDLDVLRTLAQQPLRYLGVLGPRKRTEQLLADAGLDHSGPASLHAPMGLDIGADGPEQVGLAVVAEIQSVMNCRPGGALRDRHGPIHSTDNEQSEAIAWVRSIVCA